MQEIKLEDAPKELLHILRRIYSKPMSIIIVRGLPKTGKTDFMLFIMQVLKQMGLIQHFASNTHTEEPWITPIEALNILRGWGGSNRESKLFGYDEVIESATNRRAMSELNVGWVKFLPQISKCHMHILALVQEDDRGKMYYESVFSDPVFLRGVWTKVSKTYARFESSYLEIEGYDLTYVPRTTLRFDKDLIATFELKSAPSLADFSQLTRTLQVAMLYQMEGIGYKQIKTDCGLTDKQVQREIKRVCRLFLQSPAAEKERNQSKFAEVPIHTLTH